MGQLIPLKNYGKGVEYIHSKLKISINHAQPRASTRPNS